MTAAVAVGMMATAVTATDPPKPANKAKATTGLAAGIEIGHRGNRMAVVQVDRTPWETNRVRVRHEKTVLTPLGVGLIDTGELRDDDIAKTAADVKRMHDLLVAEYGVPADQIHIATAGSLDGASGLDRLTAAVTQETGRPVTTFSAARETMYGMKQIMPDAYMREATYADIGSGSGKLATYVPEGRTALADFRAVTFPGVAGVRGRIEKRAKAEKQSFADAASAEGYSGPHCRDQKSARDRYCFPPLASSSSFFTRPSRYTSAGGR